MRVVVGEGGQRRHRFASGRATRARRASRRSAIPSSSRPRRGRTRSRRPHIRWDYRGGRLGIDQTTGGHALIDQRVCDARRSASIGDPCQTYLARRVRGRPASRRGGHADRASRRRLARDDRDLRDLIATSDLRGDTTEDRTDLQVSHARRRATPTAGCASTVDRPQRRTAARGSARVARSHVAGGALVDGRLTRRPRLPVIGVCSSRRWRWARRARSTLADRCAGRATAAMGRASSEGAGPRRPADNAATSSLAAAPAVTLATREAGSRCSKGIKVQRAARVRPARPRVTASAQGARAHGPHRAHGQADALHAAHGDAATRPGAKLRSLKRAAKRGPLERRDRRADAQRQVPGDGEDRSSASWGGTRGRRSRSRAPRARPRPPAPGCRRRRSSRAGGPRPRRPRSRSARPRRPPSPGRAPVRLEPMKNGRNGSRSASSTPVT